MAEPHCLGEVGDRCMWPLSLRVETSLYVAVEACLVEWQKQKKTNIIACTCVHTN